MPVPDFQSIMLPLLKITADGQEHKQGEVKDKLALQFQLDDTDQEEKLHGGGLRFDNNVAWSVVYLRKAGLLENSKRGIFHITEQGREILKNNPTKIDIKYLKQYPPFREWQEASIKTDDKRSKRSDRFSSSLKTGITTEISGPGEGGWIDLSVGESNNEANRLQNLSAAAGSLVGIAHELRRVSSLSSASAFLGCASLPSGPF